MSKPGSRKISQADVARLADVSVSTVSRALAGGNGISVEVRNRIREAAAEIGYVERTRGNAIDVVVYLPMHPVTGGLHQVFKEIFDGVREAAEANDVTIHPRMMPMNAVDLACVTHEADECKTNVALMFYIDPPQDVADFFLEKGALVLVNNIDHEMRFDCAIPNDFGGSLLATRKILEKGHRKIAYVTGNNRFSASERRRGFLAAVDATPGAEGIVIDIGHDRYETAYDHFDKLFSTDSPLDWTGLVCGNDLMAVGIMNAAERNGIKVPNDLSIVAFYDLGLTGMTSLPLTTIHVDCKALGVEIIRLLQRRIADPTAVPIQLQMGVNHVPGATVHEIDG